MNILEKNELFEKSYDKYFLNKTSYYKEINDYVAKKLNCYYVKMPDMKYVMADINHTFGINPLHYTPNIYEYFYNEICSIVFKKKYQDKKNDICEDIKAEYYKALDGTILREPQKPLSQEVLACLSMDKFEGYLQKLATVRNCIVIISVKDTVGYWFNTKLQKNMQILGLKENLINELMVGYVAIIRDGVVLYEKKDKDCVQYKDDIDYYTLSIKSQPYKKGNNATIQIDGVDYAINKRGFNIVLLDLNRGKVIDSLSFDTHVPHFDCTRTDRYLYNDDITRVDIKRLSNKIDLLLKILNK